MALALLDAACASVHGRGGGEYEGGGWIGARAVASVWTSALSIERHARLHVVLLEQQGGQLGEAQRLDAGGLDGAAVNALLQMLPRLGAIPAQVFGDPEQRQQNERQGLSDGSSSYARAASLPIAPTPGEPTAASIRATPAGSEEGGGVRSVASKSGRPCQSTRGGQPPVLGQANVAGGEVAVRGHQRERRAVGQLGESKASSQRCTAGLRPRVM